jgi:membrane protein
MFSWIKDAITNPKATYKKAYRWFELFADRLDSHHTFMLASGIAFNILLYLIPIFLILVLSVRLFLGPEGIIEVLNDVLLDFLPPTKETYDLLDSVSHEVEVLVSYASVFGFIGGITLLWLSSLLISTFRTALNTIFHLKSPRIFILYRFKDMLLIIILTVLILIYSYALPIVTFMISLVIDILPAVLDDFATNIILIAFSLMTSFLLIYFIFRWVPNERIPRKPRLFATGLTVIMIEISRHIFAWYMSSVSNYGKFYGTYAVIVSIAVWIYYSALIILLSAEFSKFIYDEKWAKDHLSHETKDDSTEAT